MQLTVGLPDGTQIVVEAEPTDTIYAFQAKLKRKCGFVPDVRMPDGKVIYGASFDAVVDREYMLRQLAMEDKVGTQISPGGTGLLSLGNTCYMNATLQCLFAIKPLQEFFLSRQYQQDVAVENELGLQGQLAHSYHELLSRRQSGTFEAINPTIFQCTLGSHPRYQHFLNSDQHDALEFVKCFLDCLHEDLNVARGKQKSTKSDAKLVGDPQAIAALECKDEWMENNCSRPASLFYGLKRMQMTCQTCERSTVKFDMFDSITLPLWETEQTIHLTESLAKCSNGHVSAHCKSCQQSTSTGMEVGIWDQPPVLILQLCRYSLGESLDQIRGNLLGEAGDHHWIKALVDFPEELDLAPYLVHDHPPDAALYDLFGVVNYHGELAEGGHYTSYVKAGEGEISQREWYCFDDARVSKIEPETIVSSAAYLLFYQRRAASLPSDIKCEGESLPSAIKCEGESPPSDIKCEGESPPSDIKCDGEEKVQRKHNRGKKKKKKK